MNALSIWCIENGANSRKVMNILQDRGLVSDNCVSTEDVANVDAQTFIEAMESLKAIWNSIRQ